jgi:hypothetical protein
MSGMTFGDILQIAEDAAFVHPKSAKLQAVVHSAVYKKSSKGNDMLVVHYRITGGPNAGKGRPVRQFIMFDSERGHQMVSNIGFPASEFRSLKEMSPEDAIAKIASFILDKPCAIDLEPEEFNGRPQNKVTWVHPPQPGGRPSAAEARAETSGEEATPKPAEARREPSRSTPPAELPF